MNMKCPICGRDMIEGPSIDEHHLIPREYGGRHHPTIIVHRICHTKIHSAITNRELWHTYNTPEKLREHPEISKFIKWVRKKDPEFIDQNKESKNKRRYQRYR